MWLTALPPSRSTSQQGPLRLPYLKPQLAPIHPDRSDPLYPCPMYSHNSNCPTYYRCIYCLLPHLLHKNVNSRMAFSFGFAFCSYSQHLYPREKTHCSNRPLRPLAQKHEKLYKALLKLHSSTNRLFNSSFLFALFILDL